VAVVGRLVQKWERDSTKGETIHKKLQNRVKIKPIDEHKKILKKVSRVIRK
jgi:hypothetical protein